MNFDFIAVIDFGSQYNQLIARRVRELGVYSELLPYDTAYDTLSTNPHLKGIILSGGPQSVYEPDAYKGDERWLTLGVPILGICYGMQWLAAHLKGTVSPSKRKEYGRQIIEIQSNSLLFHHLPSSQTVWMSHGDQVTTLPIGFHVTASSSTCPIAAMEDAVRRIYAVQFHPEVQHSEHGQAILERFVRSICHAKTEWSMAHYLDQQVLTIRQKVGSERVLLGLSGGVDSSVAAMLLHRAIGDQLTCVFVDNGLLRQHEAEQVIQTFHDKFHIHIVAIDASNRFLDALRGVTEPERKRKVIGCLFVDVFQEVADSLGDFAFLGQGTLYTDIIESGTKTAQTIKSHHNVGGLPSHMKFKVIEPLNQLFKDEARQLGIALGLAPELVWRQPFPGPGLAIRIMGEVTTDKLELVRLSDAILQEEIVKAYYIDRVWQYFTVLPGVKTVGVKGDQRSYEDVIVIRAVTSVDGMTADWARIPYDLLSLISSRIVNEVRGINRVLLDITTKPPATIEWE